MTSRQFHRWKLVLTSRVTQIFYPICSGHYMSSKLTDNILSIYTSYHLIFTENEGNSVFCSPLTAVLISYKRFIYHILYQRLHKTIWGDCLTLAVKAMFFQSLKSFCRFQHVYTWLWTRPFRLSVFVSLIGSLSFTFPGTANSRFELSWQNFRWTFSFHQFLSCVERTIMHCSFKTASSFTLYCLIP